MTDNNTSYFEQCFVNVRSTFITDTQPTELTQPGQRPFDDPTEDAKSTAVSGASFRKNRFYSFASKLLSMRLGIIAPVRLNAIRFTAWPADFSRNRRNRIHQRQQLSYIAAIGAGQSDGKLAVYSINKLPMFFHHGAREVRDTVNLDSSLAYFIPKTRQVKTSPEISRKEQMENWPVWSADGKYLYFCRALKPLSDTINPSYERYLDVRYDLVRIRYDVNGEQWGQVEDVLLAKDTGRSITMPRTSPDGRWLSFCMIDNGYFPCWYRESDLFLMDLKVADSTGGFEYKKIDINSNESESWQSWSSNSRWMVFSSKRDYGVFTRTYICYVDRQGNVYKPILLPQKNPAFYDSCLWTYTVPELVVEPVKVAGDKLGRVVRGSSEIMVDMPITMATPKADEVQKF